MPAGDWRTSAKDAPAAGMTAMGIHLTDLFLDLLGPATEAYAATTSRVAYDNGYREGLRDGESAARSRRSYDVEREKDWRKADSGYNRSYGNKDRYRDNFRNGYNDGYRAAYDRYYNGNY